MATRVSAPLVPEANIPTSAPAPAAKAAPTAAFTTLAPNPVQDTVTISSPAAITTTQTQAPAQPVQPPTTAQIVLMERLGQSVQQIATHFGMSIEQVLTYLQQPTTSTT